MNAGARKDVIRLLLGRCNRHDDDGYLNTLAWRSAYDIVEDVFFVVWNIRTYIWEEGGKKADLFEGTNPVWTESYEKYHRYEILSDSLAPLMWRCGRAFTLDAGSPATAPESLPADVQQHFPAILAVYNLRTKKGASKRATQTGKDDVPPLPWCLCLSLGPTPCTPSLVYCTMRSFTVTSP